MAPRSLWHRCPPWQHWPCSSLFRQCSTSRSSFSAIDKVEHALERSFETDVEQKPPSSRDRANCARKVRPATPRRRRRYFTSATSSRKVRTRVTSSSRARGLTLAYSIHALCCH